MSVHCMAELRMKKRAGTIIYRITVGLMVIVGAVIIAHAQTHIQLPSGRVVSVLAVTPQPTPAPTPTRGH